MILKKQSHCPCCYARDKKSAGKLLINLPKYPVTEFYRKKNEKLINDALINQRVLFCDECDHLFLQNVLNVDKIKSLGWEPTLELKDGLKKTFEWYKENYV